MVRPASVKRLNVLLLTAMLSACSTAEPGNVTNLQGENYAAAVEHAFGPLNEVAPSNGADPKVIQTTVKTPYYAEPSTVDRLRETATEVRLDRLERKLDATEKRLKQAELERNAP